MNIAEVLNNVDLSFLKSNRFWALVIGAIAIYLEARGLIGNAELILIDTIAFAFIGVRTIDRLGEKMGSNK